MPDTEAGRESSFSGGGQFSKFSINRDQDRPKKRKRNAKNVEARASPSSSSAKKEYSGDETRKSARSCAECKRMKLKCDRVFPCTTCVKRGLEGICPDGSLVTGRGTRYVLANTEELHEKILRMADRIRTLEDALASLHQEHSMCRPSTCQADTVTEGEIEPHPLLQGDLLLVKGLLELYGLKQSGPEKGEYETLKVRASSTSSDSATKEETYQVNLDNCMDLHSFNEDVGDREINQMLFPGDETNKFEEKLVATREKSVLIDQGERLLSLLPPRKEVEHLSHQAIMNVSWLVNIGGRSEPLHKLLCKVYDGPLGAVKAQDIALILIICAIGARVDIGPSTYSSLDDESTIASSSPDTTTPSPPRIFHDKKGRNSNKDKRSANKAGKAGRSKSGTEKRSGRSAHQSYILAKEALSEASVQSEPDFTVLQCLYLMTWYLAALADIKDAGQQATALIALSVKIALKLGLHREDTYAGLSEEEQLERRLLFWSIFHFEARMRLGTDRLGFFGSIEITAKRPVTSIPGTVKSFPNNAEAIYHDYKLAFVDECLMPTIDAIAKAPKLKLQEHDYYDILALDRRIRDFDIPELIRQPKQEIFESLNISSPALSRCNSDSEVGPSRNNKTRPNILAMIRTRVQQETLVTILHLHRAFFYAHIRDYRPLVQRRFLPSAVASFCAACEILVSSRDLYATEPELAVRLSFNWYNAFCAAMALFLLVVYKPFCPVALLALQELEKARNLFHAASANCYMAARSFPILREFYAKAHSVFQRWLKESEDEISVFGPNGEVYLCQTRIDIVVERLQAMSLRFSADEAEATSGLLSLSQYKAGTIPTARNESAGSLPLPSSGADELDEDLFYDMWDHVHKDLAEIVRRVPDVLKDAIVEPRRATAARLIWGILVRDEPCMETENDLAPILDVNMEPADLDWAMFTDTLMHSSTTHDYGFESTAPPALITKHSAPLGLYSPAATAHPPTNSQSSFALLDMCGELESNTVYPEAMDDYESSIAPETGSDDTGIHSGQNNGFGQFLEQYSRIPHIYGESTHDNTDGDGCEHGAFCISVPGQKETVSSGSEYSGAETLGYLWEHRMRSPYLSRP